MEAGDWLAVLLDEALHGEQDLKRWDRIVEQRKRVYVTDSQSVFDYLHKDSTSTSSDKRMAIEGALLRETVRHPMQKFVGSMESRIWLTSSPNRGWARAC